jgi:transcription antitermination factor NusG
MSANLTVRVTLRESATGWHVLYTRHQHEKTVRRVLANKGFETFLPLCRSASRWKDRTKIVDRPLFPCYVFVRGVEREWLNVLKTPGVQMLVPGSNGAAVVPDQEIDAVRRLTKGSGIVEPHPFLKSGDRVRVRMGPFAGVEGYLIRKKNGCRLVVGIEILGKAAAAEIDAVFVERLGNRRISEQGEHESESRRIAVVKPWPMTAPARGME